MFVSFLISRLWMSYDVKDLQRGNTMRSGLLFFDAVKNRVLKMLTNDRFINLILPSYFKKYGGKRMENVSRIWVPHLYSIDSFIMERECNDLADLVLVRNSLIKIGCRCN